jgi:hypothetical protein
MNLSYEVKVTNSNPSYPFPYVKIKKKKKKKKLENNKRSSTKLAAFIYLQKYKTQFNVNICNFSFGYDLFSKFFCSLCKSFCLQSFINE